MQHTKVNPKWVTYLTVNAKTFKSIRRMHISKWMAYKWGKLNVNFNLVKDSVPEYTRNTYKSVIKWQKLIWKMIKNFNQTFFKENIKITIMITKRYIISGCECILLPTDGKGWLGWYGWPVGVLLLIPCSTYILLKAFHRALLPSEAQKDLSLVRVLDPIPHSQPSPTSPPPYSQLTQISSIFLSQGNPCLPLRLLFITYLLWSCRL